MREFQWVDFTWDDRQFPNPEAMLKGLHERGLKVCVWINPYVAQKSVMFDEGMEQGYLVKKKDGSIWQWDRWQAGMGLVDFTNPEASTWYRSKLESLLDMGVDTFKTDFGERIPTEVVYYDGSDPEKMHNYYTYLYNEAVFSLLEEKRGKGEALVFARSATVGGQKFPVHWGGDCRCLCQVSDTGVMILEGLSRLPHLIFSSVGWPLGCSRLIADCTAMSPIVCLGISGRKLVRCYAIL
jgi:alpha-D-xyloside xylohydrolase